MCEAVGHPVVRLRRVRIGPITDEHIRPGEFRDLSEKEVAALKRAASGTRAAKTAPDSARTHPASTPQAAPRSPASAKAPAGKPARVSPRRAASPRTAPAPTRRPRQAPDRPRRG
jgi:hypothetical protein